MTGRRTPISGARTLLVCAAFAGLAAACGVDRTTTNPNCSASANNQRFDLTRPRVGKMLTFRIDPTSLVYHYIDARQGDTTQYDWTWNPDRGYFGTACLRFATTDSVRIDTTGAFQLGLTGTNTGWMDRRLVSAGQTVNDSIVGSVFFGCEGDGGTFHVAADSSLTYVWANGDAHWIFNPLALHRLQGDTISSSFTQSAYGDSVRSSMRFDWVRAGRLECGDF